MYSILAVVTSLAVAYVLNLWSLLIVVGAISGPYSLIIASVIFLIGAIPAIRYKLARAVMHSVLTQAISLAIAAASIMGLLYFVMEFFWPFPY